VKDLSGFLLEAEITVNYSKHWFPSGAGVSPHKDWGKEKRKDGKSLLHILF
jgi:hypothetical protein